MSEPALLPLPLLWSGVGALRRDPRATERSPEKGAAEPGIRKENGEESERLWAGRRRESRSGREWREPERTGRKEGEGRGRKLEEAEGEAEENVTDLE